MDPTAVILSVIAFFTLVTTSIVTPLIVEGMRDRRAAAKEARDYKRQDEVARRLEAVAATAAEELRRTNEKIAKTAKVADEKLDVIHTLVNSGLTASEQRAYDATLVSVAMTKELIALKQLNGIEPSPEALTALAAAETTLKELRLILNQKQTASRIVERQQRIALANPEPDPAAVSATKAIAAAETRAAAGSIAEAVEAGKQAGAITGEEAATKGAEAGAAAAAKAVLGTD